MDPDGSRVLELSTKCEPSEAFLAAAETRAFLVQRGVDLSGASLRSADFTRSDLRGSDLSAVDPATTELRHAIITADQAVVVAMAMGLDVRPD